MIKKIIKFFTLLITLILFSPLANAELLSNNISTKRLIPIYEDFVVTYNPPKFPVKPATETNTANLHMSEFVPEGQSIDNWSEMLTVIGNKDMNLTPLQYFTGIYKLTENVCGAENTAAQIMKENDKSIVAVMMCGKLKNGVDNVGGLKKEQGELAVYRIYKAGNNIISVFYSWRGKSFDVKDKNDKNYPVTNAKVKEYIQLSYSTLICSKNTPEGECKELAKLLPKLGNGDIK